MTALGLLRDDVEAFAVLRDAAAEQSGVVLGAVQKDYWAVEVLGSVCAPLEGVEAIVFKAGTSLSKVYGIIERFSEDIDVVAVLRTGLSANQVKKTLRRVGDRAARDLEVRAQRVGEGRGFVNTRFDYGPAFAVPFLSAAILAELTRNVVVDHPDVIPVRFASHTLGAMRRAFPEPRCQRMRRSRQTTRRTGTSPRRRSAATPTRSSR